jgi:hypothetical protein
LGFVNFTQILSVDLVNKNSVMKMAGETELIISIVSLIVAIVSMIGIVLEHFGTRERIVRLETKVEPFWKTIQDNVPALISTVMKSKNPHSQHNPNGEGRKRELLDKLEKKTLNPDDAKELQVILDKELADARQRGDIATIIAILLLLGLVAALIYAASQHRGN